MTAGSGASDVDATQRARLWCRITGGSPALEQGYTLRGKGFSALGFTAPDYRIDVFDLATGEDIDGLIGLGFLDQFNDEIRSREGRIRIERAAEVA